MAVLYRKYRPQTFSEVLGQKYIVQTLKNQVAAGSVAHAYLFTGSRGVGKTSIARILAKAVNCLKLGKDGDPCGKCTNCKQIEMGNFMDLVEIDAASNTGVDNIRDLIEHVKFAPSVGKYKVFIIDEVHMLSKGAFNALLKTLEEPPSHTIFILATTETGKVPATIISRTQRFDFKSLSEAELAEHLAKIVKEEKLKLSKEALELVAAAASGSVRDALSLLDKVLTLGNSPEMPDVQQLLGITDRAWLVRLFDLIVGKQAQEIPGFFDELLEHGVDFAVFNRDFLEFLREKLVSKLTESIPENYSIPDIIFMTRLFLKSYKDLGSAPSPDMPLLLSSIEAAIPKNSSTSSNLLSVPPARQVKQPTLESVEIEPEEPKKKPLPAVEKQFETQNIKAVDSGLTLDEILPHWPAVVVKVAEMNGPLGSLVKNAVLVKLEQGMLHLGVQFAFHKQNLENQKNLKTICEVLEAVSGKRLAVRAVIVKEDKPQLAGIEALDEALKLFGGELVE